MEDVEEYLLKRGLKGIGERHLNEIKCILKAYLKHVNYRIEKRDTLNYIHFLKEKYSISRYRKQFYQINKFLKYLGIEWLNDIELPPEPLYIPKRVSKDDIIDTMDYFSSHPNFIQFKALIMLGTASGLRAEELYQLEIKDLDLANRTVYVKHEPDNGKTTKTGKSRISFFNEEARHALGEYFQFFNEGKLKRLFSQTTMERAFRNAPIRVKDFRKFFSQEWDRRGGPTSIKKILMGHSLKGDVDLMHYNCQSEGDLKAIYDKVKVKIF